MGDLVAAVKAALNEQLPEHAKRNAEFAVLFAVKQVHSAGGYNVANVDAELLRIRNLQRACVQVQNLFNALHSDAKEAMRRNASERSGDLSFHPPTLRNLLEQIPGGPGARRTWPAPSPPEAFKQLGALHDALAPAFDAARAAIEKSEDAGQIDWRRMAAVEDIRRHWTACTGKRAPKSINPATPFGRYAESVFVAAGLGSAKGAFSTWSKSADQRQN